MTIEDRNIIWLDLFPFLTYQKKKKILELFGKGKDIKSSFLSNKYIREILADDEIAKMSNMLDNQILDRYIEKFNSDNIIIITINDPRYPKLLLEIASPPLCLYCKGNIQLLDSVSIAVVGTRRPTDYGVVTTKQFVKELVQNDVTIVSGMAVGIDTIAHKTALENQGKTIAVLAGGLYHIYPAVNQALARKMIENNLILSENSPNVTPTTYYFPIRNRIVAGLSSGVLIPEAGEKSGSLHTAKYADDFNREVYAIPGKITSEMSKGTNSLIKELKAHITLSPDFILEALHINKNKNKIFDIQLDILDQSILNYIQTEKKTFQEIADFTHIPASELNSVLFELEMNGLVTKLANNSYIKT